MSCSQLCIISLVLKLIDIITTICIISRDGYKAESNPIVRYMIEYCGLYPGLIINGIIFSLMMMVLYNRRIKGLLIVSVVMMLIIVIINIINIFMTQVI
jgi:hypothetical protein